MAHDRSWLSATSLLYRGHEIPETLCHVRWLDLMSGEHPAPWHSHVLLASCHFKVLNTIDHFFCEFSSLLSLSCSYTYLNQLLLFIFSTFNEVSTLFIIPVLCVYCCYILQMYSACVVAVPPPAPPAWPLSVFFLRHPLLLYSVPNSTPSRHKVSGVWVLHGGHPHVEK